MCSGIIPALAGNTDPPIPPPSAPRDHPRSRGEYTPFDVVRGQKSGSSPLSRGIRRRVRCEEMREGIIPALAGNTSPPPRPSPIAEDHPRSRGEYFRRRMLATTLSGSSPLSRGIPHSWRGGPCPGRIIPALAGNTCASTWSAADTTDHPRSRGEYSSSASAPKAARGSSPLSRGILCVRARRCARRGIIPALAGNTPSHDPRDPW